MRFPNGYGSVYKLSGKRRNPWTARVTTGWTFDAEKQTSYPTYKYLGYFTTRTEALEMLVKYNQDPNDLNYSDITFEEVYKRWSEEHYPTLKSSAHYKVVYKLCESIKQVKFIELKLAHLQRVVDQSGKNRPTLLNLKNLFLLMYEYAVKHEIVTKDKKDIVLYLDINKTGNPNARAHKTFSKESIQILWFNRDNDPYISTILILIYTGLRVRELLNLKKEDIHLDERWFYVRESKTKSGIREVPIAEKIVPFFETWLDSPSEYLIHKNYKKITYQVYYNGWWVDKMNELKLPTHTPHDTRHTCISLMTEKMIDERIIRSIVGHSGKSLTESVYTHIDLPSKITEINKI